VRRALLNAHLMAPMYAIQRQFMAIVGFNTVARLEEIETPTLVLSGTADRVMPSENARVLVDGIAGAAGGAEGAGHGFLVEKAGEANAAVLASCGAADERGCIADNTRGPGSETGAPLHYRVTRMSAFPLSDRILARRCAQRLQWHWMAPRRFTLQEAESLLPRLTELLVEMRRLKEEYDSFGGRVGELDQKMRGNGHMVEGELKEAQAGMERAAGDLNNFVGQVNEMGCELKDIDQGLIDFRRIGRPRGLPLLEAPEQRIDCGTSWIQACRPSTLSRGALNDGRGQLSTNRRIDGLLRRLDEARAALMQA
jgi:hypothetical protein